MTFKICYDRLLAGGVLILKIFLRGIQGILLVGAAMLLGSSSGINYYNNTSNSNLDFTLDLNAMAMKLENDIKNDIYSAKDTYTGYLTGYGADCPLCSGHLACMSNLDVLSGDVTYEDKTYGKVNIVASSKALPCGTIIRINEHKLHSEPMYAIVLDRGVSKYNLDLLTVSEAYAYKNVGRSVVSYDVLRKGW